MRINWGVRFKNKTWLMAFGVAVIAFIYQILGMFGIVPPITENDVVQIFTIIVNALVFVGIVQDPTTKGVSDSEQALTYTEPK